MLVGHDPISLASKARLFTITGTRTNAVDQSVIANIMQTGGAAEEGQKLCILFHGVYCALWSQIKIYLHLHLHNKSRLLSGLSWMNLWNMIVNLLWITYLMVHVVEFCEKSPKQWRCRLRVACMSWRAAARKRFSCVLETSQHFLLKRKLTLSWSLLFRVNFLFDSEPYHSKC